VTRRFCLAPTVTRRSALVPTVTRRFYLAPTNCRGGTLHPRHGANGNACALVIRATIEDRERHEEDERTDARKSDGHMVPKQAPPLVAAAWRVPGRDGGRPQAQRPLLKCRLSVGPRLRTSSLGQR
jgi:hypothetical protein